MGKYLEIAQRALEQTPQASIEDRRITKDQQLKGRIKPPSGNVRREISELSEISPEAVERIDWGENPLVQSVDKRSKKLLESPDELQHEAGADWGEVSNDPAQLVAFADSLAIVAIRKSGGVPDTYTATTKCQTCASIVPIWQGCPPQVRECPWCMNGLTAPPIPGG